MGRYTPRFKTTEISQESIGALIVILGAIAIVNTIRNKLNNAVHVTQTEADKTTEETNKKSLNNSVDKLARLENDLDVLRSRLSGKHYDLDSTVKVNLRLYNDATNITEVMQYFKITHKLVNKFVLSVSGEQRAMYRVVTRYEQNDATYTEALAKNRERRLQQFKSVFDKDPTAFNGFVFKSQGKIVVGSYKSRGTVTGDIKAPTESQVKQLLETVDDYTQLIEEVCMTPYIEELHDETKWVLEFRDGLINITQGIVTLLLKCTK